MRSPQYSVPTTLALVISSLLAPNAFAEESEQDTETMIVRSTAEEALKQQPGVSIITAEDIAKQPPVNDLSDIIRKMPGVNLTGNSASGSRGNNRQIDIRGMGPENTLILIDGVPVTSRNAVRYSWRGERDTRGDSNWVPAEMVERIEVLRGPAAARYGSGAAGGVVNIITKRPTNTWHGSLSFFTNQPENNKEGTTNRANFNLSGPLAGEALTMRLYGNINKTEPDAWDINHAQNGSYAAGREGVRNKDINALLSWKMTPQQILDFSYAYSRQGNIYAGDTQYSNGNLSPNGLVDSLYGHETNRLYRQSWGLTYNGLWDWGQSKAGVYYEKTNNTRLQEGSTGRVEGMINSEDYATSRLESWRTTSEFNVPFFWLADQTLTLGMEWNHDQLNLSQELGDMFTLKAGIARVFKAPNLYQSSKGYLLSTRGNGCPNTIAEGSCYLLGNPDLDPEISINKEIGIEFNLNGYAAGVTWFRNDYKNKIVSGTEVLGYTSSGNNILQWQNGGKAVVEGLEGNLLIPVLRDVLSWRTNATWMLKSESKETGNPLSVIPKYTVNTMLDWQVNDALSANVNWTLYGRQKPRQYAEIRNETGTLATTEVGAYSIVGIGTQYQLNRDIRLNAGISNLFDKQLYRENAGASTYNEPGRAYYAGVTLSF